MQKFERTIEVHIGKCLRQTRIFRGMSQHAFAAAAEIPPARLEWLELGNERISAALLARFARILKVPPSFFFRGLTTVADNDDEEALASLPNRSAAE